MNQKKALIIGGGNGIGLSLARNLIGRGYFVQVLDIEGPPAGALEEGRYDFRRFDLMDARDEALWEYARDEALSLVMFTAGIGRVAAFEWLHPAEIRKLMTLNATATIAAARCFYERLKGSAPFSLGVMGSIAALVSSPLFSVYAASKAALYRFAESVNIELEAAGTANRVTLVCPGSIKGTRFSGGENDLSLTKDMAEEIAEAVLGHEEMLIPDESGVYRGVLARYREDAHAFGLDSYRYKMASGRADNARRVKVGYLSGTFDLFHIGHLNLIRRAKSQCDYLIVGVHDSGAWKGKETFIPFEERLAIVGACQYVDRAVPACDEDSDAWEKWRYDRLFVGSDYKGTERFKRYEAFFADKGVEIVYFPYTQTTSSTQIRQLIVEKGKKA